MSFSTTSQMAASVHRSAEFEPLRIPRTEPQPQVRPVVDDDIEPARRRQGRQVPEDKHSVWSQHVLWISGGGTFTSLDFL